MTVLDQAFIKAYVERGVVRKSKGAKRAATAVTRPEAETAQATAVDATAVDETPAAVAEAAPTDAAREDAMPAESTPLESASVARFMAALDRPLQTAQPARQQRRPATVGHDDPPGLTVGRTWEPSLPLAHAHLDTAHSDIARLDSADLAAVTVLPFNAAALLDAPLAAASEPATEARVGWVECNEPHQESPEVLMEPAAKPQAAVAAVVEPWQPALQMDRFFWPQICTQLHALADEPLKALTEALAAAAGTGRKVVALAGCSPNSGSTTLLLAAGHALARRGLRVLLADAVRSKGQLAHRLGWIPTATWEDVWDGRAPLQEAVVESVADHLAVLPRAETTTTNHAPPRDDAHIAADLKFLGPQYDLVLVDLGPLDDSTPSEAFAQGLGSSLDAIVLVHNVRSTTPNRLAELERWLSSAGVSPLGVIQNFVRG